MAGGQLLLIAPTNFLQLVGQQGIFTTSPYRRTQPRTLSPLKHVNLCYSWFQEHLSKTRSLEKLFVKADGNLMIMGFGLIGIVPQRAAGFSGNITVCFNSLLSKDGEEWLKK